MTAFKYCLLTGLVAVEFWLIGLPVRMGLDAIAGRRLRVLPTPLVGLVTCTVLGWYWYKYVGPVRVLAVLLMVAGVVALVVRTIRRRATRPDSEDARHLRSIAATVIIGFGLVLFVAYGWFADQNHQTVASKGNADMTQFVTFGQHILDESVDTPGPVVGFDASKRATDAPGTFEWTSFATVGFAGGGPIGQVWLLGEPILFFAAGMSALLLALTAYELLGCDRWTAAVVGVLSCTTATFGYLITQGFLSQLIAMGLTVCTAAQLSLAVNAETRRLRLTHAVVGGVLLAAGISGYPQMVLPGTAIILVPLLVARAATDPAARSPRRLAAQGGMAACAVGSMIVLMPAMVLRLPDTLHFLATAQAGWPLHVLTPTELLGFVHASWAVSSPDPTNPVFPHASARLVLLGGALLAAMAALGVLLWRKGQRGVVCYSLTSISLILVAYYALYNLSWGPSYKQWKFATFFAPSFLFACLMLCAAAISLIPGIHTSRIRVAAAGVALLLLLGPMLAFTIPANDEPPTVISSDQINLRANPALADLGELNVNVGGVWDTMWVSYFLRNKRLFVESPSAFIMATPPAPQAMWTLTRQDAVPAEDREVASFMPIDGTYALVRAPAP